MRTNLAQILKNIGIGCMVLALVATIVTLALALSNGGPAVPYSDLRPFTLLMLPSVALLSVGLLMERYKQDKSPTTSSSDGRAVAQTGKAKDEYGVPSGKCP
jgi:hypothetical protein